MFNLFGKKADKESVPQPEGSVKIEAVPMEANFGPTKPPPTKEVLAKKARQREIYDTIAALTKEVAGINRWLEEKGTA